ncbi:MAG: glycosyltransferase family 4 protein [Lentimicrobiaceae bacterium]|jgi:glycosyltransferase involved in cell wall biosynthesis
MNVLFLTIAFPQSFDHRNIHSDLMEEFAVNGHTVFVVCSRERRHGKKSELEESMGVKVLRLKTLNITSTTNWIEKGLAMVLLPYIMIKGIKKFFPGTDFDLVLYSTPPITYDKVIKYLKRKYNPLTYLLLKDITPQNAVDLGVLNKGSLIWEYFRREEKLLYTLSDFIGCMSPANVKYLLNNNPQIPPAKVEICANSMRIRELEVLTDKDLLKTKYGIPTDKTVILYGGNLGKPQGISFLLDVLKANKGNSSIYFIIIGNGTEFNAIKEHIKYNNYSNVGLQDYIPKKEYNDILQISDIGLLFLDKRFTFPNFPTRVLDYMEYSLPIISATDAVTDIGSIIESNDCGFGVLHGDIDSFQKRLQTLLAEEALRKQMGNNARALFEKDYTTFKAYQTIINHCTNNN